MQGQKRLSSISQNDKPSSKKPTAKSKTRRACKSHLSVYVCIETKGQFSSTIEYDNSPFRLKKTTKPKKQY